MRPGLYSALRATVMVAIATTTTPCLFAWDSIDSLVWPDGIIELRLELGDSPLYSDGSTPNQTAMTAIGVWNPLMKRVQLTGKAATPSTNRSKNGRNEVYFDGTINGLEFGDGVLAVTLLNQNQSRRTEADVVVNSGLTWDVYTGSYRGSQRPPIDELRRVLVHEFGHVLGLGHPDEAGQPFYAIMNSWVSALESPEDDDKDGIGSLYGFTPANPGRAPVISDVSPDRSLEVGYLLQLDARVTGTTPLARQWYHNGSAVPNGTEEYLFIDPTTLADAGDYTLVASNIIGSTTSAAIKVTVTPKQPLFTNQTAMSATPSYGSSYEFYAIVEGSDPTTYQWFKDGQPIPGATSDRLQVGPIIESSAGSYYYVATNPVSSVTGPTNTLTVTTQMLPSSGAVTPSVIERDSGASIEVRITSSQDGQITWYHDGQIMPYYTSNRLPGDVNASTTGDYNFTISNSAGTIVGETYTIALKPDAPAPTAWTATTRDNQSVYFLYSIPSRVERFDLSNGTFAPAISLSATGTALAILDGQIYYTSGTTVRRIGLDGSADTMIYNGTEVLGEIFVFHNRLYTVGPSLDTGSWSWLRRIDPGPNPTVAQTAWWTGMRGFSSAYQQGKIYAVDKNAVVSANVDSTGEISPDISRRSIYNTSNFPFHTWMLNAENAVLESGGNLLRTSDLKPLGKIPLVVDATAGPSTDFVALHRDRLIRYSALGREINRLSLAISGASAVASNSTHCYVFRANPNYRASPLVESHLWTDFSALPVAPAKNPATIDLYGESIHMNQQNELLILDRVHANLFVWSTTENRFTRTIPLSGRPNLSTYSRELNRLYFGYADSRITQIDFNDSRPAESSFATAPGVLKGLAACGNTLLTATKDGNGVASYDTLDQTGQAFDRVAAVAPFSAGAVWNASQNRLFHLTNEISGAYYETIEGNGQFGTRTYYPQLTQNLIRGPIVVEPTGQRLVLGSALIVDAQSLTASGKIEAFFDAGVWTNQHLFTTANNTAGTQLSRRRSADLSVDLSVNLPGHQSQLFENAQGQIVATTLRNNQLIISVFDDQLTLISRFSHLGKDLSGKSTRLANLSSRVRLTAASGGHLTAGFVIAGNEPLTVLVRAVGPGLKPYGINDFLTNPALRILNTNGQIQGSNTNWTDNGVPEITRLDSLFSQLGAFALPADSHDAALTVTLAPGAYTAEIDQGTNSDGIVLVEVYAVEDGSTSRLVNLSTRTDAGTGEAALIAGFVISGEAPQPVLIRGAGPSLAKYGVQGYITNPRLILRHNETSVATNDDWAGDATVDAAAKAAGAFDFLSTSSQDAALVTELAPGAYTAEVSGATSTDQGNALVEIYRLNP